HLLKSTQRDHSEAPPCANINKSRPKCRSQGPVNVKSVQRPILGLRDRAKRDAMPTDLLYVFTLCATALTLWTLGLAFHTGTIRGFIEKTYSNPEDAAMGKGNSPGEDGPRTQRWSRAHRNALENLLPFAILGYLLATQLAQSVLWAWVFVAFTALRMLHTVAYVNSKQPFRTLFFFGGWVITVAIGIKLLVMNV
ncbi:MAG: putative MAPEG superfamily protein, partial [Bradymonadia bacterium]